MEECLYWARHLFHSVKTNGKPELKTKRHSGRSQLWGSWLPTLWSAGTPPPPAGTVVHGSSRAHGRPRRHSRPVLSEPHGEASNRPGPSGPSCSPTSGRWSLGARTPECWTHWKSEKQIFGEPLLVTGLQIWLRALPNIGTRSCFRGKKKYWTHISYEPTGPHAVVVSHPVLIVQVLSLG